MKRVSFPVLLLALLLAATATGVWICHVPKGVEMVWGVASSVVLSLVAVLAWVLVDRVVPWRLARRVLAGVALLAALVAVVDVVVLALTKMHLAEACRVLAMGGGFWHAVREMGASAGHVALAAGVAVAIVALGAWLYGRLEPPRCSRRCGLVLAGLALLTAGAFLFEQRLAQADMEYRFRGDYLPYYAQLFDEGIEHSILLPSYPDDAYRRRHLARIGRAGNPKHVLFIVLESVRADAVCPEYTPAMYRLQQQSVRFSRSMTEGIYTPAAFNPMFMNRFAATAARDCYFCNRNQTGALPLELVKRAGYQIHVAFSSDLHYGNYHKRLPGAGKLVDYLFLPSHGTDEPTPDVLDDEVTDKVIQWMDGFESARPSFVLLQFNATHWDYYFDASRAVLADDPAWLARHAHLGDGYLARHYQRYINATHHVDRNLARLLGALDERKLTDDTAVVVVSDHGECFHAGYYGHSAFRDEVMRIPLMLRLPGVEPRERDRLAGTGAAMATLLDYLDIEGLEPWMLTGRSMLTEKLPPEAVLTANGDQSRFLLTLPQGRIEFRAALAGTLLRLRVHNAWDPDGRPVQSLSAFLDTLPWRQRLDDLLTRPRRPL